MTEPRGAPVLITGPLGWKGRAAVGLLLAVLGGAALAYGTQVRTGLAVTGLNAPAYWGLYVVNFVFFIGLSAGGVIVASLVHAFGLRDFQPIARIAELMAIACLVLAMSFILLDLGRPDRMLFLLRHGRPQSPLIWDVTVVNAYLLISLAYGYFGTRADLVRAAQARPRRRRLYRFLSLGYLDLSPRALARDRRILRTLAVVGLVAAIALHTVTAWILGLVKARPGWYGAIMAPLFIVSATVSGLALLLVSVVFCRRALGLPIAPRVIRSLGTLLALTIPVLGYFLFAELLTVLYAREPAALRVFDEMMFGRYALVFWANLVLGLALPMLVLLSALADRPRRLPVSPEARIGVAAGLVALGVLAERWNIVIPPLLGFSHLPYPPGRYTPSLVEFALVAGVYAVGGLLFAAAARLLPLIEAE
jgi:molybdopterin-containing oxidoreductase family membrane subunit